MYFVFGDPEEIQRQQQAMIDEMQMAREVAGNELKDFLQTASQEHLMVVRSILHQVNHDDESPCAAYFEGMITAHLGARFDMCLGCGEIHGPDELLETETVDESDEV